MKKNIVLSLLLFYSISPIFGTEKLHSANPISKQKHALALNDNDYLKNTVILCVKKDFRNICSNEAIGNSSISEYLISIGAVNLKKKFPHLSPPESDYNERGEKLEDLTLIYEFQYKSELPLEKVLNFLTLSEVVEYAEPHYLPKAFYTPNDPQADSTNGAQYHLKNIRAYTGWDIDKGDTNVVIGITDTGYDFTHEDLMGSVKLNYADPLDNVDNDNDGYTDNYKGWDLGMMDNNPQFTNASPHGVFVSGCAGATTDNSKGIAGSGFKCKLLPIKISDDNGYLTMAYEGIVYAADHGCQIINCSWGGTGGTQFGQSIVNYATFNKNALVMAAAGNNDAELVFYPAAYENVINVGGSDSIDKKWDDPLSANHGSNYGIYLDVFAPGEELYSTWQNNTYLQGGTSGTSFACPVAAGVAGIIKSHFPNYSAKQIGEQLKVTCDNMDLLPQNTPYLGKLGFGRVNLFRALTETNLPSVEMSSYMIFDNNDNALVALDTARLVGVFKNYLFPASSVTVSISSNSPFVSIINNTASLGAIGTLATAGNTSNPFTFKILPNTPLNHRVVLKVSINNGVFISNQYVEIIVNVDYINVAINDVATSVTSTARIGYSLVNQDQGLGFTYLGSSSLLYEGGLMVGNSINRVSDMVRSTAVATDNDFSAVLQVQKVIPSITSDFDLVGYFNDDAAGSNKLGVFVRHDTYAWAAAPNRKYILRKYTLYNNSVNQLDSLYAGVFADWDIQNASYNKAAYDSIHKMGYVYSTQSNPIYCGIKLVSGNNCIVNSIDNLIGGAGGIDISDGYTSSEKFQSLSTNRLFAGNGSMAGNDVVQVVSSGPYFLAPDDSATLVFAMIAGNSLNDLQNSASKAQMQYDSISAVGIVKNTLRNSGSTLFPNPALDKVQLKLRDNFYGSIRIGIFDLQGKELKKIEIDQWNQNSETTALSIEDLKGGMYFLKINSASENEIVKLLILK